MARINVGMYVSTNYGYVEALYFFRFNLNLYQVTTLCLWSGSVKEAKPLG